MFPVCRPALSVAASAASCASELSSSPAKIESDLVRLLVASPPAVDAVAALAAFAGAEVVSGVLRMSAATTGCAGLAAALAPVPALVAAPSSLPSSLLSLDEPFGGEVGAGVGIWSRPERLAVAAKAASLVPAAFGAGSGLFVSLGVLAVASLAAGAVPPLGVLAVVPTAAVAVLPLDVFDSELLSLWSCQFALRVRGAFAMPLAVFAPVMPDCGTGGAVSLGFVAGGAALPLLAPAEV